VSPIRSAPAAWKSSPVTCPEATFTPPPWDGDGFFTRTTAGGDRVSLARYSLRDHSLTTVDAPGWDVEDVTVSADGRTAVWMVNEDGRSVLRARRDGKPLSLPPVPDGVIEAMDISADGSVLALMIDTPSQPLQPAVASLTSGEPLRYLTDPRPPALRSAHPVTPELCRYPAGDGTPIPALLYRPPAGVGPHPVVLSIHGGPEFQARPWYDALNQCLLASGIAVFEPNVRGSTGYGHAWQTRIYRDWGGIDLDDFAAAAAYLRTQSWADPERVAVMGKSYGGFGALSCMSRLPELWAAGVSVYGPANLDTFARAIPAEWATVVNDMFGDLDKDAAKLRARSPLTYASQIKAPLLVIQGANDPRVPKAESDQIVDEARANGVDVSYLVFDDEGHGFTSRDNDIKAHTTIAEFLIAHLLPALIVKVKRRPGENGTDRSVLSGGDRVMTTHQPRCSPPWLQAAVHYHHGE
jgi:dipeptidyl aminopeptidase/acylaminoacyl peptidase